MRRQQDPQVTMLPFVDLEARVRPDHPLRTIKVLADRALAVLSPEFDRMYADVGRPSLTPERLLKASHLISLYPVRSERAFCEELDGGCENRRSRWSSVRVLCGDGVGGVGVPRLGLTNRRWVCGICPPTLFWQKGWKP